MNFKTLSWLLLIVLSVIWGSSFIFIKWGLEIYSSDELGALRIVFAFIVMLPLALRQFKRIPKDKWKYLIIIGIIGNGIPSFLYAEALTKIDSILGAIMNTLIPLFTLFISISFYRFKASLMNIIGILLGLIGAIGLLIIAGDGDIEVNFKYGLLIILANICLSMNLNIIKKNLSEISPAIITAFVFFTAGIPASIYLFFFTDFTTHLIYTEGSIEALCYIAALGVFGSAIATIGLNKLIHISSPIFASSVTYIIPVIAILWGVYYGERFDIYYVFWMIIIFGGITLVNKKANK